MTKSRHPLNPPGAPGQLILVIVYDPPDDAGYVHGSRLRIDRADPTILMTAELWEQLTLYDRHPDIVVTPDPLGFQINGIDKAGQPSTVAYQLAPDYLKRVETAHPYLTFDRIGPWPTPGTEANISASASNGSSRSTEATSNATPTNASCPTAPSPHDPGSPATAGTSATPSTAPDGPDQNTANATEQTADDDRELAANLRHLVNALTHWVDEFLPLQHPHHQQITHHLTQLDQLTRGDTQPNCDCWTGEHPTRSAAGLCLALPTHNDGDSSE